MDSTALQVGLLSCPAYDRQAIKEKVDLLLAKLAFAPRPGQNVLLKPNLVAARGHDGLACTHPLFCAAVAEWCLDCGARVAIGDSPAFGRATRIMAALGYNEAFRGLPVRFLDFGNPRPVRLRHGDRLGIAAAALDCDLLVNLPKLKTHCQLLLSLAVKNFFGTVVGFRKPWLHARHGEAGNRFEAMLVDLPEALPGGVSLLDGVTAMHAEGPVRGEPFALGLVGGAVNPVALDTAVHALLGIPPAESAVWRECRRRGLPGAEPGDLHYPLATAADFATGGFRLPSYLRPVSFRPTRLLAGAVKRIWTKHLGG